MLFSRLLTVLLAPAGVVAAHALVYGVAHGWEHERQAMLSGHGPFAMLSAVALPLALVGLVVVVATSSAVGRPRIRQQAAAQLVMFAVALFLERGLGVQPLAEVLHDPMVWLAVAGQLATATLVVVLIRTADRSLGRCIRRARLCSTVGADRMWTPSTGRRVPHALQVASLGMRGPPGALVLSDRS